jgi:hypothetical protein
VALSTKGDSKRENPAGGYKKPGFCGKPGFLTSGFFEIAVFFKGS